MEEKKQVNRLGYSTIGKRFRGFLCMLTFCALVLSAVFVVYGIMLYGTEIITEPKENYMESSVYQADLFDKTANVLYNLQQVYLSSDENKVSIIDMESDTVYYYDALAMVRDYKEEEDTDELLADIDSYKQYTVHHLENILTDYDETVQYLEANSKKDQYLYFDGEMFKEMFEENGYRNTDNKISDMFSEDSYFIFYYPDELSKTKLQKIFDSEDTNESEDFELLQEIQYAVYDAAEDVFYSSWDEYFMPMDYYLYDVGEVATIFLDSYKEENFDSIIIPLLWSQNLNNGEFWEWMAGKHSMAEEALASLNSEQGVFVYSIENAQFELSNVTDISEITKLEYSYKMTGNLLSEQDSTTLEKLTNYEYIKNTFDSFPDDSVFYFGMNPSQANNGTDNLSKKCRWYTIFANGICYSIAATVLFLVLLIVQAVWLIVTTGRKEKKGKEIVLNKFDEMPTEIWAFFVLVIMLICGVLVLVVAKIVRSPYVFDSLVAEFAVAAAGVLPFGFFFMILTLSMVRRRRADNMWSASILKGMTGKEESKNPLVRTIRGWLKACRESFQNLKGIYKLLFVFVIYIAFCECCFVIVLFYGSGRWVGNAFWLYQLLQIVAMGVVIYIIKDTNRLIEGVKEITQGNLDSKVRVNNKTSMYKELSDGINHIGDGLKMAVETSLKDERMKTELITNVSHDLKTPLTSIINYINLLKTEKMPTPEAEHYIEVLDTKAQRLRNLTEDLVEAAKATSGNIELEMMPLTFDELMKQAFGEFEEKFEKKNLTVVVSYPENPSVVMADGRRMFRIIENILQNAYKYALEGTRIYADLSNNQSVVTLVLKNVSAAPLNISAEELMERFTRGDESRTTEGSGLGLSIAKDLTRLQGGTFDIILDGDLFKVIITFPEYIK